MARVVLLLLSCQSESSMKSLIADLSTGPHVGHIEDLGVAEAMLEVEDIDPRPVAD